MNVINRFFVLLISFFAIIQAFGRDLPDIESKCILPNPDGNEEQAPHPANIHGIITKKTDTMFKIKNKNKEISIKFNENTVLYTVYGGDFPLDALSSGQEAWVWFKGCKMPLKGYPIAVMIHILSVDPIK